MSLVSDIAKYADMGRTSLEISEIVGVSHGYVKNIGYNNAITFRRNTTDIGRVKSLVKLGMSTKDIAKTMGVPQSRIRNIAFRYKLCLNKVVGKNNEKTIAFIVDLYSRGTSARLISETEGISINTVYRWVKKYGAKQ